MAEAETSWSGAGPKASILIVDDEIIIASDLEGRLKMLGYAVCGKAVSARRAIELAEKERPDLVMMDIGLRGEMDGIDAAEIIRDRWGIPVIFLTAYVETDRLERAKLTYPFGYLLKPFQERDLKITVEMALYVAMVDARRKKALETVEQQRRYLNSVLQTTPDGFWSINPDGTFADVNEAYCQMTGYTREEFLQLKISDTEAKEDAATIQARMQRVKLNRSETFETRHLRKDGSIFDVEISASYIDSSEGRFIAFCRDITKRKQAELEKEKLQAHLVNAVEVALLGPWEYDVLSDRFTFNDHFYKIFRTTAEEVGGYIMSSAEYASRFVHPDDRRVVEEEIRKAVSASDPGFKSQLEHRVIYADGAVGHISVQFFIIKDARGSTVKTYGVNQDITSHKQVENRLREMRNMARAMYDAVGDGVFVHSMQSQGFARFIDVNETACRRYGYTREEFLNMNVGDITPDEETAVYSSVEWRRKVAEKGRIIFEATHITKSGERFPVEINSVVFEMNNAPMILSVARDISERKKN